MLFTRTKSLTRRERNWLDAQRSAWLSIWEVESVEPGRRLELCDRLTGERRKVLDARASKQLVAGHHVLARVVDFERHSYLCGMHPHPLTTAIAGDLVDEIRRRLRAEGTIMPGSLHSVRAAALVTDLWSHKTHHERRGHTLFNPEGDPFVLTVDRFSHAPGDREAVAAAIAAVPGVEAEDGDAFVLLQGDSIIANLVLTRNGVKVESNSLHRADLTRRSIERNCGGLLQFVGREFELGL